MRFYATITAAILLTLLLYPQPTKGPPSRQAAPEPPKQPTIKEQIEKYVVEYKADPELSYWIAWCESELKNVPNENGEQYGIGPYQFIKTTWNDLTISKHGKAPYCTGDIWNEEDNVRCGVKLISELKIIHWGTAETDWGSFKCWAPKAGIVPPYEHSPTPLDIPGKGQN